MPTFHFMSAQAINTAVCNEPSEGDHFATPNGAVVWVSMLEAVVPGDQCE